MPKALMVPQHALDQAKVRHGLSLSRAQAHCLATAAMQRGSYNEATDGTRNYLHEGMRFVVQPGREFDVLVTVCTPEQARVRAAKG
jgi:hypothetical protein